MAKRPSKKPPVKAPKSQSVRDQVASAHEAARVARRAGKPFKALVEKARELERTEAAVG